MFFAAAVAKLRHSGLAWVSSDNLRDVLLGQHYDLTASLRPWGLELAEHRGLCTVGALSIVLVEALAPLALFSTAAACVLIPALFGFVIALPALLGITFWGLLPIFVFWIGSPARATALAGRIGA